LVHCYPLVMMMMMSFIITTIIKAIKQITTMMSVLYVIKKGDLGMKIKVRSITKCVIATFVICFYELIERLTSVTLCK